MAALAEAQGTLWYEIIIRRMYSGVKLFTLERSHQLRDCLWPDPNYSE